MATLFQQPGSPYWYAFFFDGSGRRLKRSTKEKKKSRAMGVAAQMEKLARRANQDDQDRVSAAIFQVIEEAGTQALRGQLNEAKGRELLNRMLEISTGQKIDNPSVGEWLTGWLEDKKGSRAEGTYLRYEFVVNSFLSYLPSARKRAPIGALTVGDIREFRNLQQEGGRSPATVNMAVKILRIPLSLAKRHGYVTSNVAEAIELLTATVEERDVFTSKQVSKLVKTADRDWQGLILAGFYTGGRLSDLANLKSASVNLDRGTITFVQSKTGRPVEIPIHPELKNWLKETLGRPDSTFVFPSLAGKSASGRNGLSAQFKRLMQKAKISGRKIERAGEKGRDRSTLSFHSLRHSFNSEMANAGIPQEMRQRLTGHASKAVNDRYTHAELNTLRNAVESVPKLL